jgi:hypothetical protein
MSYCLFYPIALFLARRFVDRLVEWVLLGIAPTNCQVSGKPSEVDEPAVLHLLHA